MHWLDRSRLYLISYYRSTRLIAVFLTGITTKKIVDWTMVGQNAKAKKNQPNEKAL